MNWPGQTGVPGVAPERDQRPEERRYPPRSRNAAAPDLTERVANRSDRTVPRSRLSRSAKM
jgi:hypothetical protein